jgi:hypothetical protein
LIKSKIFSNEKYKKYEKYEKSFKEHQIQDFMTMDNILMVRIFYELEKILFIWKRR